MKAKKRILAIGAHHDDVELGCGGSLLKWKAQGHSITVFTASSSGYRDSKGKRVRKDKVAQAEGLAAAEYLGATLIEGGFQTFEVAFGEALNRRILDALTQVNPDLVLTHWTGDAHHDHRELALAAMHCCKHIPRVLMYCSNWYDTTQVFAPRFFVNISSVYEGKKELVDIYQSERGRTGTLWSDFIDTQSALMGLKAGVSRAEGFEVVRWLD
jgi:LmbE family N-acetylglucosaminyl deacetylase